MATLESFRAKSTLARSRLMVSKVIFFIVKLIEKAFWFVVRFVVFIVAALHGIVFNYKLLLLLDSDILQVFRCQDRHCLGYHLW